MQPKSDWELLCSYARFADHQAFAELVRRHIGFVRAAALRQTRDAALADDVTQAVIIVLARRASTISSDAVLASWLFTVTRHAAQNAMKTRARQRYHEHQAARMRLDQAETTEASNADVRDVLDEAIARLPALERSGVLLHYFCAQSHEEVGTALGLSGEAARKRVARALGKMRAFLAGRGVVVSGAALVAAIQSESAVAAAGVSSALVTSAVNVAMLSGTSASTAGSGSLAIACEVSRMLTILKLKAAAAVAVTVVGVAGATAIPLRNLSSSTRAPMATMMLHVSTAAGAAEPKDASPYIVEVAEGVRVEFLGVSPYPGDDESWFNLAGEPIPLPDAQLEGEELRTNIAPDHQLAVRIKRPADAVAMLYIDNAMLVANSHIQTDQDYILLARFTLQDAADTVSARIGVATQPWKTVAETDQLDRETEVDAGEYGTITLMPPVEDNTVGGGMKVEAHHQHIAVPYHIIATDKGGNRHQSNNVNVRRSDDDVVSGYTFDVAADDFAKVEFQIREFDKIVEAKDISLSSEKKTKPQITVSDFKKGKD